MTSADSPPPKQLEAILELLTRICETPAPTFAEGERGRLLATLLKETGLEPHCDEVGNITADLPGGQGPRVLLAAHLDTVFAADTDVGIRHDGGKLRAPGVGDNSASLAVLVHYVRKLQTRPETTRPRLSVAATVGEEGLGDLRGIRHLMDTRASEFDMVIAVDGHLGTIVHAGVGSRRYRVTFHAKGGHSWGDFPSPSAVHALGDTIHALNQIAIPSSPRSSYNVGEVWGGTSVNAIAEEAGFTLDLRSVDATTLYDLDEQALACVHASAEHHAVRYTHDLVGDRPVGSVPNEPLVNAAKSALGQLNIPIRLAASSTDANAAMAIGIPAIAFGVYRGGDAHRLREWLEPNSLWTGLQALELLLAQLSKS